MPEPSDLITGLLAFGMTETEIAGELRAMGVEVTQGTINRIKTGAIKRTSFDIGLGLVQLHARRASAKPVARACTK